MPARRLRLELRACPGLPWHHRIAPSSILSPVSLLRVSVIVLEMQDPEERMEELSGTFVFLYRMLGGL